MSTITEKTAKVEIRLSPSEKASWQAEAEGQQTTVSELVRQRMKAVAPAGLLNIDLQAEPVQSLRAWVDLEDSDGVVDAGLLAAWKAFATDNGVSFTELLRLLVVDANAAHLD